MTRRAAQAARFFCLIEESNSVYTKNTKKSHEGHEEIKLIFDMDSARSHRCSSFVSFVFFVVQSFALPDKTKTGAAAPVDCRFTNLCFLLFFVSFVPSW
jgi:hypothetical protein